MEWSLLLLDFVPLLVFVVLDSLSNVRYAVLGAVLAAALELGYSYFALGSIDSFSILFASFVLLFAGLSYKFDNPVFFKFKPAVIGALSGVAFLATSAFFEPLLLTMVDRYIDLIPTHQQHKMQEPAMRLILARFNLYLGFARRSHGLGCLTPEPLGLVRRQRAGALRGNLAHRVVSPALTPSTPSPSATPRFD
jgi:intracellular septation protein A